jgi:hypothetical protein
MRRRKMAYTDEEYRIYRKVQREFLMEDARNFVADYIANERDCDPEDIDDDELDKYDYEYLVKRYEKLEDCNVAFNDTWQYVVEEYMEDFEEA